MDYSGPKAKDIVVESDVFNGLKFGASMRVHSLT